MMMAEDPVAERRNWFRYFPDGPIEFNAILRVLAVLLLAALMIVGGTQRPQVLVALVALLWLDHALVLWWLAGISADLEEFFGDAPTAVEGRVRTLVFALIPVSAAALLLAPWSAVMIPLQATRAAVLWGVIPALVVIYVAGVVLGSRALQRSRLGSPALSILILIPVIHWFATDRVMSRIHDRIRMRASARGLPAPEYSTGASIIAEIALVVALVFWVCLLIAALSSAGGRAVWIGGNLGGMLFGSVFAIAQIAAMESLQKAFLALLRKT